MNKKQLFERMIVPLKKRVPPDTYEPFLCWDKNTGAPVLMSGKAINEGLKKQGSKYFIYQWMRIYGGAGGGRAKLSDKDLGV